MLLAAEISMGQVASQLCEFVSPAFHIITP